jgi:hypothetical protein
LARTWGLVAAAVLGWQQLGSATESPLSFEGVEYAPAGKQLGDQFAPSLAYGQNHGVVVWEDNAMDGNGLGIGARRMNQHLSGVHSAFRVNEVAEGDQRFPSATVLDDGTVVFAWQSGVADKRSVIVRLLGADGVFLTGDLVAGPASRDSRHPKVISLTDGTALVGWAMNESGERLADVHVRRIAKSGEWLSEAIQLNVSVGFNHHHLELSPLAEGKFAAAWVSEIGGEQPSSQVLFRIFDAEGKPVSPERIASEGKVLTSSPSITTTSSNEIIVVWSELSLQNGAVGGAQILGRAYDGYAVPFGSSVQLNTRTEGDKVYPKIASLGEDLLVVWESSRGDGFGKAIMGRVVGVNLVGYGSDMIVNTTRALDQMQPTLVSDGDKRLMVAWVSWTGLNYGMGLMGQRFAPQNQPLSQAPTPHIEGLSSWQIRVTWPELEGMPIGHYEVYLNGSSTPITVAEGFWNSEDLLPGTAHSVRIAYVLADGRRSPLSQVGEGRTWGKDNNGDGLPDDWQALYFGSDSTQWPSPSEDSDGDGVSNRDEFFAGTDPTDVQDVLRARLVPTELGLRVEWNSKPGVLYQLQLSEDLVEWHNLGGVRYAADSTDSVSLDAVPANSYFRVNRLR